MQKFKFKLALYQLLSIVVKVWKTSLSAWEACRRCDVFFLGFETVLRRCRDGLRHSLPVFSLGFWLVRICPNDKFDIEIFARRFHYFEDPFHKFCALNLPFQDTSYSLALKYVSFLFKFFSFACYNINFWFKISKICPNISHFSQIFHSRGNTARYILWRNTASIMMIWFFLKFAFVGYCKLLTSVKPRKSTQCLVIVISITKLVKSRRWRWSYVWQSFLLT